MNVSRTLLLLALAQASAATLAAEAESLVPDPGVFVEQAAQTGLTEIEAAKAALAKSDDPDIRSFAQRMVQDHGKSNLQLATLALNKGLKAPSKLDAEHQALLNEINSKTGTDFDRTYSEHMNMGHTKALALFEAASKSPDPQRAEYAKQALPTLQEHKKLAEKLPGKVTTSPSAGG